MRYGGFCMRLKSAGWCPQKGKDRGLGVDTQRRRGCRDAGREWSVAATTRIPQVASGQRSLRWRQGVNSSSRISEEQNLPWLLNFTIVEG